MGCYGGIIELNDDPDFYIMDEEDFYDRLNEIGAQCVHNVTKDEELDHLLNFKKEFKNYFDFGEGYLFIKPGTKELLTKAKVTFIKVVTEKFFALPVEEQVGKMEDFKDEIATYIKTDYVLYMNSIIWGVEEFIFKHDEGIKYYFGNVVEYKY